MSTRRYFASRTRGNPGHDLTIQALAEMGNDSKSGFAPRRAIAKVMPARESGENFQTKLMGGAMVIGWLAMLGWLSMSGCLWGNNNAPDSRQDQDTAKQVQTDEGKKLEMITLGGGCFWCTEAVFLQVKGVEKVVSGYMGGTTENPTYKQICTGQTGHAEVIQVHYDPQVVRVERILEIFWGTHDPTTLNRQGADIGTQYRSAVFFHQDSQRDVAEVLKKKLDEAKVYDDPIVTEITAASKFYPAEDYHQNYYNLNSSQGYCRAVIKPKLEKLKKVFAEHLKSNE